MTTLADDWITLWHSELAALASDREAAEAWQATVALWAHAARLGLGALSPGALKSGGHEPGGRAGSAAATGSEAAAAAPDPCRDARLAAQVERLAARVAELERRVAGRNACGDVGGDGQG